MYLGTPIWRPQNILQGRMTSSPCCPSAFFDSLKSVMMARTESCSLAACCVPSSRKEGNDYFHFAGLSFYAQTYVTKE